MHVNDESLRAVVSSTRRTYDESAEAYVRTTDTLDKFPGLDRELDRFFAALPGDSVLDLGCGSGRDSDYLIRRGATVVAGDLSEVMLRTTRDRCAVAGVLQLDLLAMPFADGVFDGVWACASVLHVPRTAHLAAFVEIHRVLAKGGVAAISLKEGGEEGWVEDPRMSSPRWFSPRRPEAVVGELGVAGFTSARVFPSGRGTWFVVEAKKT
ncbi:class I SAM-dependent methyltransferase [Amycolatopsis oliviviridis]|uniref:Methyltransferase n=1 Tax=Amycolatopsis oliviviridis TaxID=1471590 RepID=A0ABQ3L8J1_9PSEU|nr:methyltransferase [Amycolatopsis oliviviridis]